MLIEHMPRYYRNSDYVKDITNPMDIENDRLEQARLNMLNQFNVGSATYRLKDFEKEYGLPIEPLGITTEERRSRIKARMRSIGTITTQAIKTVVDSWVNGNVDIVENPSNYSFLIKFTDVRGIPSNMQDVYNAIEEIKPAHLAVSYEFKYNTVKDLNNKNLKVVDLLPHTVSELLEHKF